MDPGNLLKRNLKRKVDVSMDKKIDENVTGTPALALNKRQKRILQPLDNGAAHF